MFRGIKHQFNACTEQVFDHATFDLIYEILTVNIINILKCFNVLLTKLNFFRDNESSNELVFQCISKTVESMADYTKKDHTKVVWKCFYVTFLK